MLLPNTWAPDGEEEENLLLPCSWPMGKSSTTTSGRHSEQPRGCERCNFCGPPCTEPIAGPGKTLTPELGGTGNNRTSLSVTSHSTHKTQTNRGVHTQCSRSGRVKFNNNQKQVLNTATKILQCRCLYLNPVAVFLKNTPFSSPSSLHSGSHTSPAFSFLVH